MELIIIPTLTTIALIAMQALEFIQSRRSHAWAAPLRFSAELRDAEALQILESAPALPAAQARTEQAVESSPEQRAA